MSSLRVFIEGAADGWTELTDSGAPAVRVQARDLQQAQRASRRLRTDTAASVVLDLRVLIAADRHSARRMISSLAGGEGTYRDSVHYIGTAAGLAGLLDDIHAAGVADGVTLIPAVPTQDVRAAGEKALRVLRASKHRAA